MEDNDGKGRFSKENVVHSVVFKSENSLLYVQSSLIEGKKVQYHYIKKSCEDKFSKF